MTTPTDFSYEASGSGGAGRPGSGPAMSIFANRAQVRQEMREDALNAGFDVRESASLAALLADDPAAAGRSGAGRLP